MNDVTRPERPTADCWSDLAALTPARIALGRSGSGMPTRAVLDFAMAHAQARDAVHTAFDSQRLASAIRARGHRVIEVESLARTRADYLRNPGLGRALTQASRARLADSPKCDIALVIADGLSSAAVHANALPTFECLSQRLLEAGLALGPIVIARQARVALGDDIGEALGARLCIMLLGERPGLSAADSMGAYITYGPARGRNDAQRNCVSNIRAEGLSPEAASQTIAWLALEGLRRAETGVTLKAPQSTSLGEAMLALKSD